MTITLKDIAQRVLEWNEDDKGVTRLPTAQECRDALAAPAAEMERMKAEVEMYKEAMQYAHSVLSETEAALEKHANAIRSSHDKD